jgi:hypothetical protein
MKRKIEKQPDSPELLEQIYNSFIQLKDKINLPSEENITSFRSTVTRLNKFLLPDNESVFYAWLSNNKKPLTKLVELIHAMGFVGHYFKKVNPLIGITVEIHSLIKIFFNIGMDPTTEELGQLLYALGSSAILFKKPLNIQIVQKILVLLDDEHLTSNSLFLSMWGLNKLNEVKALLDKIDAASLQKLFDIIFLHNWTDSTVKCLVLLRKLAALNCLEGTLDFKNLNNSLILLQDADNDIISTALSNLGQLTKHYIDFQNHLNGERLQLFLEKILSNGPKKIHIRHFIKCVDTCVSHSRLEGRFNSSNLQLILTQILLLEQGSHLTRNIQNFFCLIRLLAETKKITNQFNSTSLQEAVNIFLKNLPEEEPVYLVFLSLGILKEKNLINKESFAEITAFNNIINQISTFNFSLKKIDKIINTMPFLQETALFNLINRAVSLAQQNPTPKNTTFLIHKFIIFKHYEKIKPLYTEFLIHCEKLKNSNNKAFPKEKMNHLLALLNQETEQGQEKTQCSNEPTKPNSHTFVQVFPSVGFFREKGRLLEQPKTTTPLTTPNVNPPSQTAPKLINLTEELIKTNIPVQKDPHEKAFIQFIKPKNFVQPNSNKINSPIQNSNTVLTPLKQINPSSYVFFPPKTHWDNLAPCPDIPRIEDYLKNL